MEIDDCPRAVPKYQIWRHPIRWFFKDRKKFKLMNALMRKCWNDGLRERTFEQVKHAILYGNLPR